MTNPTPHGQVPEALRIADEFRECLECDAIPSINDIEKAEAELRRLHAYCQELEAHVILDCMTHVQNPAEIEHVAGDVSKNGAESNTMTLIDAYAEARHVGGGHTYNAKTAEARAKVVAALRTQQPAPAGATYTKTHELLSTTVGLLMGYREGGARQPYKPGSVIAKVVDEVVDHLKGWPYPEPTPPAHAADSVLEDAARLDWLLLRISGAEFRRIGVHYSGNASRADVDAARKQGANHD